MSGNIAASSIHTFCMGWDRRLEKVEETGSRRNSLLYMCMCLWKGGSDASLSLGRKEDACHAKRKRRAGRGGAWSLLKKKIPSHFILFHSTLL